MTHVLRAQTELIARTRAVDSPGDLLDHFASDGFAWLDDGGGFVTAGTAVTLTPEDAPAFLRALRHNHDGNAPVHAGPRAVGALTFAGDGHLVVPSVLIARDRDGAAWCTIVEPAPTLAPLHIAARMPSRFTIDTCMTLEHWHDAVATALTRIHAGELEKVVLARAVRVEADRPFDTRAVLRELRRTQPGCIVYAGDGFVGASPELLIRKRGRDLLARPLAGTETDAARLLASTKDAHEHQVVAEAVVRALGTYCDAVRAEGPAPVALADVIHLATTVTARSLDDRTSVIDLVRTLHPTPAVAGTPRNDALDTIRRLEPIARGRYAGPCGWVDGRGDGAFVVALRGGAIEGARAVLHAGAGIVAGSDPDAEWAETQQKFEPMLRALVRP